MAWTLTVEVAFTTAPMSASPSWTDITQYVKHVEGIGRTFGRPDEFSDVQPGTLSLTLKNADGRFTMFNTAGAYYPNVKVGKRIRVTATRSAVTYRRFDGHVDAWQTGWPSGNDNYAEVQVTATDRLQRFGAAGELRSMFEEEALEDTPVMFYPLSEPSEATSASSIATTPQGAAGILQAGTGGTLEFAAGRGPGADGLAAPIFTYSNRQNGKYLNADLPTTVGTTSEVTLECWLVTDAIPTPNDMPLVTLLTPSGGGGLNLHVAITTGAAGFSYTISPTDNFGGVSDVGTTNTTDGLLHHVCVTLARSGSTVTYHLYVDGVDEKTDTFTTANLITFNQIQMGATTTLPVLYPGDTDALFNGTLAHVVAYSTALSAARVLAHYNAGANGLSGERTDQRVGRIADWINYPSADRALDTGDSTVGAQATSGRQPLDAMQEISRTESGVVFVDGDGKLTFHNRSRRFNTTATINLNMATGQAIGNLEFPGDDFGVQNDVSVSRADGGTARSINQTSIDDYGLRRESVSITSDTDEAAQALADWRANNYANPLTRIPNVTVDLQRLEATASSQVALLLAATIGTHIQLTNVPAQGPTSTVELFVEGLSEQFNQKHWQITFNTSPAGFYQAWELGDTGFSELGATTILGY